MTRADLIELVGVPWRLGGRSLEGLDCLGLVLECCHRDRIEMCDVWATWKQAYASGWRDFELAIPPGWEFIELSMLGRGAVLVLEADDLPCHLAYVLSGSRVLTTTSATGAVSLPMCSVWKRIRSALHAIPPARRGAAC